MPKRLPVRTKHGFVEPAANLLWSAVDDGPYKKRQKSALKLAINKLADPNKIPRKAMLKLIVKYMDRADILNVIAVSKKAKNEQSFFYKMVEELLQFLEEWDFGPKHEMDFGRRWERQAKFTHLQRLQFLRDHPGEDMMNLKAIK